MSKSGDAAKEIIHFYGYKCRAYELKASPHYRTQNYRFARQRNKETEQRER